MRKSTTLRNEELLFLVLCKDEDRRKLLNEKRMHLQDFERLTYITYNMGLESYTNYLYFTFPEYFKKLSEQILKEIQNDSDDGTFFIDEDQYVHYEKWLEDFCQQLPSKQLQDMYIKKFDISLKG